MSFDYFIDEIVRAYHVLNTEQAYVQNRCDILDWLMKQYIDESQADRLSKMNYAMAKERT